MFADQEILGVETPFAWPVTPQPETSDGADDDSSGEIDASEEEHESDTLQVSDLTNDADWLAEEKPEWDSELDLLDSNARDDEVVLGGEALPGGVALQTRWARPNGAAGLDEDTPRDEGDWVPEAVVANNPFALLVEPATAFEAAKRLERFPMQRRRSSLENQRGKELDDELARFDADIELEEAAF